ncbi:sensor histidine kinase [Neolewinella aurantiaca]|uniref:sensor histidine kinase n=1 Tax=Neolewinella aurantiaca TaxID=2602767 RepID=UPI00164FC398|nr:GAF domain-containing sensor histidine kinase [Neolewinella aurantiaca]
MTEQHNRPIPPKPDTEAERLRNLRDYNILDSEQDQAFDDITALASYICGTTISLVSLVDDDRQWFKSSLGLRKDITETPRDDAFCAYNIMDASDPFIVQDARKDVRFADNPLVTDYPRIAFYAGAPLVSREGHTLGSLCVIDQEEKELNAEQIAALERLARQVVQLMEHRQALQLADTRHQELQKSHETLKDFSNIIAHDLKAPLRNIRGYTEIIREDFGELLPPEGNEMLRDVVELSDEARSMVDGVLRYGSALNQYSEGREDINLKEVVAAIGRRIGLPTDTFLTFEGPASILNAPRIPVEQILQNLIGNSIKFSDKSPSYIKVSCCPIEDGHSLRVWDNGPGMDAVQEKKIFTMFYSTAEQTEKDGHGVGLNIVKRMTELLGGRVEVAYEEGAWCEFNVLLPEAGADLPEAEN